MLYSFFFTFDDKKRSVDDYTCLSLLKQINCCLRETKVRKRLTSEDEMRGKIARRVKNQMIKKEGKEKNG